MNARPGEDQGARLAKLVRRFERGSRVPGWDESVDLSKDPGVVPDPATTPVPDDLRAEIEDYMARYPDRRSAAIPALRAAQRRHGWLPPSAFEQVAAVMRLTPGYLIAVATFYDMLETEPKGEHTIYVCTNISCSLRGADRVYQAMIDAAGEDERFNIRSFECLGACDIAPMASIDGTYVGPLHPDDCKDLIARLREGEVAFPERQLVNMLVAEKHWETRPPLPAPEPTGRAAEGRTAFTDDVKGPGEI